tara:strand:- start:593 stop:859 length:267 start_codon:yes stop_codon:yes gene_type:complete
VNHKITKPIGSDSQSNEKQIIDAALDTKIKKSDAGDGKNDKENVVPFKRMGIFRLVMIFVKIPHQAVHNILMRKPSDTFHKEKNAYKN